MNCERCCCPLTRLRLSHDEIESRTKCARCQPEVVQVKRPPQRLLIDDMDLVRRVSREFYAKRERKRR